MIARGTYFVQTPFLNEHSGKILEWTSKAEDHCISSN